MQDCRCCDNPLPASTSPTLRQNEWTSAAGIQMSSR
jgi:hypothetical protein